MRLALSLLVFASTLAAALVVVRRLRRLPLALAAPPAMALLVLFEAILLPALSPAHLVRADALAAAHLLPAGAVLGLATWRAGGIRPALGAAQRALRPALPPRPWLLALAALALPALLSAVEYPPNTWDAMTYHLGRVAHWVFHRSVLVYPTYLHKQSVFPPGAELLLTVPQVLADSDRLAAGVQYLCWATAALAAAPLARRFGAPRAAAPLATLLVAALPSALLQASSTQNDLVAAVMALALVIAAGPAWHARRWRLRPADGILLGTAAGAAWLVKPTALVAAAPFLAWGAAAAARALRRRRDALAAAGVAAAALIPAAAAVAAERFRRWPWSLQGDFWGRDIYVYPWLGEWADRAVHSLRALGYHLGVGPVSRLLGPPCGEFIGCGFHPLRPHEDYAGNPVQVVLFLVACAAATVAWRRIPPRLRGGLLALVAGWFLLHALFRPNAWMARLELPLFALGAILVAVSGGWSGRLGAWARRGAVAAALLLGLWTAAANELRPPRLDPSRLPDAASAYYAGMPALRPWHDRVLAALARTGCGRLGVWYVPKGDPLFGEVWDYPLTWRARLAGHKVRVMVGPDEWPCLVYSVDGPPPEASAGPRWVEAELRVFVRAPPGG